MFALNRLYILANSSTTLPQEVIGYEPGLALDGGEDGLTSSGASSSTLAPRALLPGGMLCCELFEDNVELPPSWCAPRAASADVREDLRTVRASLSPSARSNVAVGLKSDILCTRWKPENVDFSPVASAGI